MTHSAEETREVARKVASMLHGGEFVALIGDLGAGKTTFVQGIVAALGSSARVKSPTFTVMNEYLISSHSTITRVVHCDFYRFTHAHEVGALELEEYQTPDTVILAEWPNILADVAWNPDIKIVMTHAGGDDRTIEISEK